MKFGRYRYAADSLTLIATTFARFSCLAPCARAICSCGESFGLGPPSSGAACANRSWMARVNAVWRSIPTNVYSPVISTSLWPAILLASIALPPTSCRHVMFARRKECGPRPGYGKADGYGAPRPPITGTWHQPTTWRNHRACSAHGHERGPITDNQVWYLFGDF